MRYLTRSVSKWYSRWMSNWALNVAPFPRPDVSGASAEVSRLMNVWNELVPPSRYDGDGDFEDFIEQAYRLDAALKVIGPDRIFFTSDIYKPYIKLSDGSQATPDEVNGIPKFGPVMRMEYGNSPTAVSDRYADSYVRSPAFIKNAGRAITMSGIDEEASKQDLATDMYDAYLTRGVSKFFVKTVAAKRGIFTFEIDDRVSLEDFKSQVFYGLGEGVTDLLGAQNQFVIQDYIEINCEYRVFIVGGEAVTGAGCIDEYTPLQNNDERFSPLVRSNRRDNTPVFSDSESVERLVAFAANVGREMFDEEAMLRSFVLDVGFDIDGNPIVIERNSMLNAGFYASNPYLLVEALDAEYA